jgi:hypothetical protein
MRQIHATKLTHYSFLKTPLIATLNRFHLKRNEPKRKGRTKEENSNKFLKARQERFKK